MMLSGCLGMNLLSSFNFVPLVTLGDSTKILLNDGARFRFVGIVGMILKFGGDNQT